jgi:hypothetical protein
MRGDSTTRFLEYMLSLPNTFSYIEKYTGPFARRNECWNYDCTTSSQFKEIMNRMMKGEKEEYIMPADLAGRKLYPPLWSREVNVAYAKSIIKPSKPFLVIPVLMHKKSICRAEKNRVHEERHLSVILFNKVTKEFEHVDDMFVEVQRDFGHRFIADKYIKRYMVRYMNTFVGDFDKNPRISVPAIHSTDFYDVGKSLGIDPPNLYESHKIFLATYLHLRLQDPSRTVDICYKKTIDMIMNEPFKAYKYYEMYEMFNKGYIKKYKSLLENCGEGMIRNLETRRCNKEIRSASASSVLDIPIHLPRERMTEDNILKKLAGYASLYFLTKYENVACMMPDEENPKDYSSFTFEWRWNEELGSHEIGYPEDFPEFWIDSMNDETIRFVVIFLFLKAHVPEEAMMVDPDAVENISGGHLNALLYDKKNNTLERYEPNGEGVMEYYDNGSNLEKDILSMEEFNGVRFISSQSFCPIGVHKLEWNEGTTFAVRRGGNCGLWTVWAMELRLNNPEIGPEKLYKKAHQRIMDMGSFKIFANGYQQYLNKIFDLEASSDSKSLTKSMKSLQLMLRRSASLNVTRLTNTQKRRVKSV